MAKVVQAFDKSVDVLKDNWKAMAGKIKDKNKLLFDFVMRLRD